MNGNPPSASATEGPSTITIDPNTVTSTAEAPRRSRRPQRRYRFYNPRKNLLHLPEGGFISRNSPCTCGSGLRYKRCCKDAHARRQQILQTIDMTGLQPGPHRLEECSVCGAPSLRPIPDQADHHKARLHRSCAKCGQVRQFNCIDLILSAEPLPATEF